MNDESRPKAAPETAAPQKAVSASDSTDQHRHDLVDVALRLAASGWPVFPCKPGAKVPATTHGFKDASTNPETIRWWWRRMPNANLAIATGAPSVDVLDVDIKAGPDGMVALERLRAAGIASGELGTVRTPSGGMHLYFRGTRQGNGSIARHGIDFRGLGGYVLVPPSVVDGKPYELTEWRPGARGQAIDWQAVKALLDPPRPKATHGSYLPADGEGDISALVRWLATQPEGGRNNATFWAACRAIEAGHRDELGAILDAAIQAGLPEWEARRTVESAARRKGAA
jgi:hypothetical protein